MKPFNLMIPSDLDRFCNEAGANPLAALVSVDARVEDEGVAASVPCDIHESYKPILMKGADVTKALG